jgi:hypothetical protein
VFSIAFDPCLLTDFQSLLKIVFTLRDQHVACSLLVAILNQQTALLSVGILNQKRHQVHSVSILNQQKACALIGGVGSTRGIFSQPPF